MKKKLVATVLISSMLFCACQNSTIDPPETSRDVKTYEPVTIETVSEPEVGPLTETTYPTFETHQPEYEVAACDFDIDPINHTIKAHYDDTADNPDGYIIDIDLTYYGYDIDEVSIYEASVGNFGSSINVNGTVWKEIILNGYGALYVLTSDENRQQLSYQAALTYTYTSNDEATNASEIIELLDEKYELYPFVTSYTFPVAEMNKYEEDDFSFYYDKEDYIEFITVRTMMDGIPIGVPKDNDRMQMGLRYGDLYGGFGLALIEDDYWTSYKNEDTSTIVDFKYYEYEYETVSTGKVIPLEECIDNALPGLVGEAYFSVGNYCNAYGAELVYVPIRIGVQSFSDFNPGNKIMFVPVWAIYSISYGDGGAWSSAVFLNAFTGELVSYAP